MLKVTAQGRPLMLFDLLIPLIISALGTAIWFAAQQARLRPHLPEGRDGRGDNRFKPLGGARTDAPPTTRRGHVPGAICWVCGRSKADPSASGCH